MNPLLLEHTMSTPLVTTLASIALLQMSGKISQFRKRFLNV